MPRTAQLADGTVLTFPDGTADEVIRRTVKQHVTGKAQPAPTNTPTGRTEAPGKGASFADFMAWKEAAFEPGGHVAPQTASEKNAAALGAATGLAMAGTGAGLGMLPPRIVGGATGAYEGYRRGGIPGAIAGGAVGAAAPATTMTASGAQAGYEMGGVPGAVAGLALGAAPKVLSALRVVPSAAEAPAVAASVRTAPAVARTAEETPLLDNLAARLVKSHGLDYNEANIATAKEWLAAQPAKTRESLRASLPRLVESPRDLRAAVVAERKAAEAAVKAGVPLSAAETDGRAARLAAYDARLAAMREGQAEAGYAIPAPSPAPQPSPARISVRGRRSPYAISMPTTPISTASASTVRATLPAGDAPVVAPAPAVVLSDGQRAMATNLGGHARPGPVATPPDEIEAALRASLEKFRGQPAGTTLQQPRVRIGAERVGRDVGLTKEEVRKVAGPVLDEALGDASPILPKQALQSIIDKMKSMPMADREAYVAKATSGKTKWQVENIRRTLEHLGLLLPAGVAAASLRDLMGEK